MQGWSSLLPTHDAGGGWYEVIAASKQLEDDKWQAEELNRLSRQEREAVYDEVHGILPSRNQRQDLDPEEEEQIRTGLEQLRKYLAGLSKKRRKCYDRAAFLKPALLLDDAFHLMFLRATQFKVVEAAQKLCAYFEHKLEIFGEEKLVRPITIDDLDEDDLAVLRTKHVYMSPSRDRTGRKVLCSDGRHVKFKHWKNLLRAVWYTVMTECMDEETQRLGLVSVYIFQDIPPKVAGDAPDMNTKVLVGTMALPHRFAAAHVGYNDHAMTPMIKLGQIIAGLQTRIRTRVVFGSTLEFGYHLMTFGIRLNEHDIVATDEYRTRTMNEYIMQRRRLEQSSIVLTPTSSPLKIARLFPLPQDVLLGRGRPFHTHTGNLSMMQYVAQEIAQSIPKSSKCGSKVWTVISSNVVRHVQEVKHGKFLKRTALGWEEVSDDVSYRKVRQACRTVVDQHAEASQQQQQQQDRPKNTLHDLSSRTRELFLTETSFADAKPVPVVSSRDSPPESKMRDRKRAKYSESDTD